jgi:ABC-type multidrug transport system fused ATPase/permease subunit
MKVLNRYKNVRLTKRSLFSWILSESLKLQAILFCIILVTVVIRVIPLEMQKRIVNTAIKLKNTDLLVIYCSTYLVAVVLAGGLKYVINILETIIGQRATANMRQSVYDHMLALPLGFFRKTQPGMVVSSLVNELAAAGDFIGMAVAVPLTNVLTLLAFGGYLLWLNPMLAGISFSIYPFILFVIPLLQKKANTANTNRVDTGRSMSGKIAETVSGIHEVQSNAAHRLESEKFKVVSDLLGKIRVQWNLYRHGIKASTNLFNNISPLLIFIAGGLMVINGHLELGSLVAFLSAQEKLFNPWKELMEFYQNYQDARVSYSRTMEYFDADPEHALVPVGRDPLLLGGNIDIRDVSFATEGGIQLLDGINLSLKAGEQLALVGFSGSGKSTLAHCIGQLYRYTSGSIFIEAEEVSNLTKRDIARNVGFVSQTPFIFEGSIEDNLLYACRAGLEGHTAEAGGVLPSLDERIVVLQQTGIFPDILKFGLNTVLDRQTHAGLVPSLIRIRGLFKHDFGEEMAEYVEFFNENEYLYFSSIARNITFGTANKEIFKEANLHKNDDFLGFLNDFGLIHPIMELGVDICKQTIRILGDLEPDALFFEHSPFSMQEVDEFKQISMRLKSTECERLSKKHQNRLIELGLRFTPGRHKMIGLPENFKTSIMTARARFRDTITRKDPTAISFYRESEYIPSHTILNNIFFGRLKTTHTRIQDTINDRVVHLLAREGVLETIVEIGMQFQVGTKGDRLSGGQRQKLAIARVFLKNPKILIMDEATSALDNRSQTRIQNLLDTRWKGRSTLIAVVHRLDITRNFDKIAVMTAGKIHEIGAYDELMNRKGLFNDLVSGNA